MANDTYLGGPANEALRYIYMYYVMPNNPHHKEIAVYFIDQQRPVSIDESIIAAYVDKVDRGEIPRAGWGVASVDWKHKSYLVFVSKSSEFTFEAGNAVIFEHDFTGGGNHTFRHGQDISAAGPISGMWCVNKRLGTGGGPLGNTTEKFKVILPGLSLLNHSLLAKLRRFLVGWSHNEVGSNVGP